MPDRRFDNPIAIADLCVLQGFGMREERIPAPSSRDDPETRYFFICVSSEAVSAGNGAPPPAITHTFVILPAAAMTAYIREARQQVQFTWLDCRGALVDEMLARYRLRVGHPYPVSGLSWFETALKELDRGCLAGWTIDELHIVQWLNNVCASIHRHVYAPTDAERIADVLLEVEHYLRTHYRESLSLERLAEFANLSVRHFCREFKRAFVRPPIEELLAIRMQRARILLRNADLSVSEAAGKVGFEDAAYFIKTFKAYYGETPGALRKAVAASTGQRAPAVLTFPHNVDALLREGWQLVHEQEFTNLDAIAREWSCFTLAGDMRIPVAHFADYYAVRHGVVELFPYEEEVMLRWNGEVDEEMKVDLVVENDRQNGINLTVALSGDARHGYRLRLYEYASLALESISRGIWEVFTQTTTGLDPRAPRYHLAFWRSDNTFHVEINGKSVLEYYDPLAPTGETHRAVSFGRAFSVGGSTRISRLRLSRRVTPKYVDILDRARTLLHNGQRQEAYAWCLRVLSDHAQEVAIRQEAQYLAVIALPLTAVTEKIAYLQQIVADPFSPLRPRCLRELVFLLLDDGQITTSVARACELVRLAPGDEMPRLLAQRLLTMVRRQPPEAIDDMLSLVATLPLSALTLDLLPISSLAPLTAMSLQRFTVYECPISELAPLANMPLTDVRFFSTHIDDLAPLRGIAITRLFCLHARLRSLAPLRGMPLKELVCHDNAIHDLSPLRGMPLELLQIAENQLADLSPLLGLPLRILHCADNQIDDLTPLRDMPLQQLTCDRNHITSLEPLCSLPLHTLHCDENLITDLSPLRALPLHTVHCGGNPLTDLSPLRELALTDIGITGLPISERNLEVLSALPLRSITASVREPRLAALLEAHPTLAACNEHTVAHVRALLSPLQRALAIWSTCPSTYAGEECSLRSLAQRTGDIAYLSLPLKMRWEEARAFSAWQGGTLVCPGSMEECEYIYDYLAKVAGNQIMPEFHIGLECDAVHRTFHWQTGVPIGEILLSAIASHILIEKQGYPYLRFDQPENQSQGKYSVGITHQPSYVLIQWGPSLIAANTVFDTQGSMTKSSLPAGHPTRRYRQGEPLQRAMALLCEYLREHPAAPVMEIRKFAATHGVSSRTLDRAKQRLGILAEKRAIHNGGWSWRLPDAR